MAAKGDITANVGLNVSGGGLDAVVDNLENKILKILGSIEKIGNSAAVANGKAGKAAEAATAKLDGQIRELQNRMGQIQSLTKLLSGNLNVNKVLGGDANDIRIARQVKAVTDFRKGMEEAVGTAEKLRVRINDINKETANLAKSGQQISTTRVRQQEQLAQTLKEYEKFASGLNTLQGKAGFLNPASQKQLEGLFLEAQRLKGVFNELAGDRRRFDFTFLVDAQRSITAEIDKQIRSLAQQERLEQRLLVNTRERAQALLATNSRDRQIDLERSARSLQNRLTPTQLSFGTAVGEEGLSNRLTRLTSAYASARRQLQDAIATDSGKSQEQIAKLVGQYERLDQKIKETIALQGRLAAESNNQPGQQPAASPFGKAVSGLLGDGGLGLAARVGIYAVAASAVYGLINTIKDGAKFVVEFEDNLATLQAISGSTSAQMETLSQSILEVAQSSKFSANEIAQATIQLAQAGFSASDTKDALASVTQFAAASGTSVKESVDLITSALGAFQLQAEETARVTDIMVAALNRSKLTSQQIAQAIQYVGTTAYEQNISLEQMVATIGSVAQAGVKAGSTLGTGFRQFLVDLANPTEKLKEQLDRLGLSLADVDVKSKGLPAVLNTLKDAGFGAAQAYEGLEVRAAAFYLAAKNNIDVSNQLMLAESERGVALRANEQAMDSLAAQTTRLGNNLAKLANDNAPINFFKGLIRMTNDLIESMEEVGKKQKELEERFRSGEFGSGNQFIQQLKDSWNFSSFAEAASQDLRDFTDSFVELGKDAGIVDKQFQGLGEQWYNYSHSVVAAADANDEYKTATAEASDAAAKQAQKVEEVNNELNRLLLQGPSLRQDTIQTSIQTNNLTARFEGLASMLGNTSNAYDNLILAMRRYRAEQLLVLGNKAAGEESAARNQGLAYTNQANSQLSGIRNSAAFSGLSQDQRNTFNSIIMGYNRGQPGSLSALNDFVNSIKATTPALTQLQTQIRNVTSSLSNRSAAFSQATAAQMVQKDVQVLTNPIVTNLTNRFQELNAKVGQNMAMTGQQTPEQRAATFAPIVKDLDKTIGTLNGLIKANQGKDPVVRNLTNILGDYTSLRNQVTGVTKPTKAEDKASDRAQRKAEADARRAAAAQQRAENKYNSNELTASQSTLKAADRTLNAYINGAGVGLYLSKIPAILDEGDEALEAWVKSRREVLSDAITKADMTPDQIAEMTAAANEEIAAKRKSVYDKQVQVIDRSITDFLTRAAKSIENQFKNANLDANKNLGRQQGLATGLDDPILGQGVPDYTRVIQRRRVAEADLRLRRTQAGTRNADGTWSGGSNEARIAEYQANFEKLAKTAGDLQDKISIAEKAGDKDKVKAYSDELEKLQEQMGTLDAATDELITSNDNLRASFEAAELAPKNFSEALSQAAQAWQISNNAGLTLSQRVFSGLGDVLDSAHQSFTTFFTDIITGSKSVGSAFGDMAKSIINAIGEMAAKAIATQIFSLLLSFIPGGGATAGLSDLGSSLGSFGAWNGGSIPGGFKLPPYVVPFYPGPRLWNGGMVQPLNNGGQVGGGLPTRDSTLVHAAKGEFMIRRSSVESIGNDLLQDMNNRGASALKGMGNKTLIMPQSQLQSNVYVVLPEEQPQLGPNDVLAIVSRDVLRNGATKQLIKQVAAGG